MFTPHGCARSCSAEQLSKRCQALKAACGLGAAEFPPGTEWATPSTTGLQPGAVFLASWKRKRQTMAIQEGSRSSPGVQSGESYGFRC